MENLHSKTDRQTVSLIQHKLKELKCLKEK